MVKTIVANKYTGTTGVNIMRGTPWGNPFVLGRDGSRDEVCDKYIAKYQDNALFKACIRDQLKGQTLVYCCKPLRCHGDWLRAVADGEIK